ncbi:MAG: ABC transporter permease [Chloroflexi bacterium]|nr:ABC transporter permease [Chloroflexota bacterium]
MGRYILRRLLLMIPTLLLVSLIVYLSVALLPGDVVDAKLATSIAAGASASREQAAELRKELGVDQNKAKQYFVWLGRVGRGDLGHSLYFGNQVRAQLRQAIPVSFELALIALIVSLVIAIPFGALSALYQDSPLDYGARLFSIAGLSVPNFVIGTLIIVLGADWFNWTPPLGYRTFFDSPSKNLAQFIIPGVVLGLAVSSTVLRMVRSSMLEVLRADYVRTARAKGLTERLVVVRHALKNAMIPPMTLIGAQVGFLIGGAFIVEQIFGLPGIGKLTLQAMTNRDYPLLQGGVLFLAVIYVAANLLVDLSYAWLDPRIRYS